MAAMASVVMFMGYLSFSHALTYRSATAKNATEKTIIRRSVITFRVLVKRLRCKGVVREP
jgi:hypothetical protein